MAHEEYDDYLKFIDEALALAKAIPRYFSKYSNRIYCNHQKLVIYVLMQKLKTTYRGIVSWLRANETIRLCLGLFRIPVHTTMIRFTPKIGNYLDLLLGIRHATTVAVDATGFELESKSYYYRTVWNSDKPQKTKRYMKLSIAIDARKQMIMTYALRRKFRHDTLDFTQLLKELNVDYVVADKGYDSKKNRQFVIQRLHAIPIIPYRKKSPIYRFPGGKRLRFDERIYHQRSKVETVFSVMKRKYGSVLRARSYGAQKVELISKLIAYNIDRTVNYLLVLIRGLHQSLVLFFFLCIIL